mgnify:CR=1 FL=1
MGLALTSCTVPAAGRPTFDLADDEIELDILFEDDAIIVLNRAVALQPGNMEISKDLALNYYFSKDYKKALDVLNPLLDKDNADDQFFQIAGDSYLALEQVKEAEKIEKSDKLLKLQVDIGDETRQIVAGLAKQYAPEELIDRKVAVVVNLQPAKLFGTLSDDIRNSSIKNCIFRKTYRFSQQYLVISCALSR